MVDTSSVQPTGLIRDLEVTIGGHAFWISTMVLQLNAQGAYPLLLGRPWLQTTHIKQNWQRNIITFQHGKAKVRVPTHPRMGASKEWTPLYAESINRLEGLADEQLPRTSCNRKKSVTSQIGKQSENHVKHRNPWNRKWRNPSCRPSWRTREIRERSLLLNRIRTGSTTFSRTIEAVMTPWKTWTTMIRKTYRCQNQKRQNRHPR